ncbi:NlpC/P60 family protein [Butyrivibrio sp. VCD2006]|uniref:NlpC/P60 family protein n=1 Tax=Butyrivibrio sp. VCD2006 TaxID=1280664 RepID=UPI0004187E28|nr:NlpC/P60 family protein [Butyrivibrio sp. VCD2006]
MKKFNFKSYKRYMCALIAATFVVCSGEPVLATTSKELKEQQKELEKEKKTLEKQQDAIETQQQESQSELNEAQQNISNIQGEQAEIQEGIDAANEELLGLLTSIDLIQADIEDTQVKIEKTQQEYDEAKAQEETLYDSMKKRIKFMYEKGEFSYAELLLQAQSVGDMLNKAGYAEELYDYDRTKLNEFIAAKEAAEQYGEELEEAKAELETSEYELKEEQNYVETVIDQYKKQYANFDVQLAKAKQNAAIYSEQLKRQTAQIRDLQAQIDAKDAEVKKTKKAADEAASKEVEEERKKKEAEEAARKKKEQEDLAAKNAENNDDDNNDQASASSASSEASSAAPSNTAPSPSGSATGQNIANYACQFVGNPYVAGGTSLTNGADCSGFVYSVYKAFGINVPRTSYSQATYGREVSYQNAQAGDVIYYGGHVGIYLGGGRIVHASTAKTGIKYENATYRTILTIRRFVG